MENVRHFDVTFPLGSHFFESDAKFTHTALISERVTNLTVGRKSYLLKPWSVIVFPVEKAKQARLPDSCSLIAVYFNQEDLYSKTHIADVWPVSGLHRKNSIKPFETNGQIKHFVKQIRFYGDAVNTMPIMDFLYADFFRIMENSLDSDKLVQCFHNVLSGLSDNDRLVLDLCRRNISIYEMQDDIGSPSKRRLYNLYRKTTGLNPGEYQRQLLSRAFYTMSSIPEYSLSDMMEKCGSYSRYSFLHRLRLMLEASPETILENNATAIRQSAYYLSKNDLTSGIKAIGL